MNNINIKLTTKLSIKLAIIVASGLTISFFTSNLAFAKRNKSEPDKMTKQTEIPTPAPLNATTQAATSDAETNEPVQYIMTSMPGEEKFEDVLLLKSRTLIAAETKTELKNISHGLRKKAVFGLVPVRVYTVQLFAAYPEKLIKTEEGFLDSLKQAGPVQLRMTFLRDIPGQKIADSFKEGLIANKINPKSMSPELNSVMSEVGSIKQLSKDDSFSITAIWKGQQSSLLLEDSQKIKTITGSTDLAHAIFSIWFGKPADKKLAELKKELIK